MPRHARLILHATARIAALLLALAAPAAAAVDPGAVGTWEIVTPTPQGVARWVWEIRADGTYRFRSEGPGAAAPHSGRIEVADGKWALSSPAWTDGGTYRLVDPNSMMATGKLGTAVWRKSDAAPAGLPAPATTAMNGQQVPRDLPALVRAGADLARQWRRDAVLVELNVKPIDGSRRTFLVEQDYYSPSTRGGLWVMAGQPGVPAAMEAGPVTWSTTPLPASFIDLPRAIEVARKNGLAGAIDGAKLIVWRPAKREPVLAWTIAPADGVGAYFVEGLSGVYLPGDVTGYTAEYNRQWDAAVAHLRDALQRAAAAAAPESPGAAPAAPSGPAPSGITKSLIHDSTTCAVAGGLWINQSGTVPGHCQ
jgi:hypothetical protein